ncbi:MAG: 50S ribosomal protein L31e [Euryarchaeota archaeon]|jgi:large subunit ribosomal protein L31e|nr:50S ribosomal protein L31e [Euryarchaeota archaeon]MEC7135900.1 50S ribosomal protein L31e [Candidatus Thermoplasmatota archaeon]MBB88685.1 50S ribosomal protein L31e [Euryarchaeota archaeon]MEC7349394.1 50S ribosomal protein L31e [Candidatus Thermoplasmatota archaeon]MEC7494312.1 50S ribosomal protein L31e [Candidatus Thermoplasmatota archaeon]|tara:strand:+ start:805 stop:1131 length:327 start_codon:yes stop_codon:yes gene_type:complete
MADDELIQERLYTIPLRKLHKVTRTRRAPVAMRMVEDFIVRHMKPEREGEVLKTSKQAKTGSGEEKQLFIDPPVNQYIWSRGIEKPPSKVRVRALKFEDGSVIVHLAE